MVGFYPTDCESCTKPISTNPESREASDDVPGVFRGTPSRVGCNRRISVVFVAWIECGRISLGFGLFKAVFGCGRNSK